MKVVHKESEQDRQKLVLKWVKSSNEQGPDHVCTNTCKCKVPTKKTEDEEKDEKLLEVSKKEDEKNKKDMMTPSPLKMVPQCKHCKVKFEKKEDYVEHIKTEHDKPGMDLTASQRVLLLPSPRFVAAIEKDSDEETNGEKEPKGHKVKYVEFTFNDLPFNCDNCDRRFNSRDRLKRHMHMHNDTQEDKRDRSFSQEITTKVVCEICDKPCKNKFGYNIHKIKMHGSIKVKCDHCEFESNSRCVLKKHKKEKHTLKRPLSQMSGFRTCDKCAFKVKSKYAFELHLKQVHVNNRRSSPPIKKSKNKEEDLNKTQASCGESDEEPDQLSEMEDESEEMAKMKEDLQLLHSMIKEKNIMITTLENETERLEKADQAKINEKEIAKKIETDSEIELNDKIEELKQTLNEEKARRVEAEEKAKTFGIKCFKLEEENEAMKNGRITLSCKVCKITFHTIREIMEHLQTTHRIDKNNILYPPSPPSPPSPPRPVEGARALPAPLLPPPRPQHEEAPQEEMEIDQLEAQNLCSRQAAGYDRVNQQTGAKPKQSQANNPEQTELKFQCTECPEFRKSEATLAAHMRCHQDIALHNCNNCSYQTNDRGNLRNHINYTGHVATFKKYLCHTCRAELKNETELHNHEETHRQEGAPKNKCSLCEIEFQNRSELRQHMRVVHRVIREDMSQIQEEIGRLELRATDPTVAEDNSHAETMEEQASLDCKICGAVCNTRSNMTIHMKTEHFSHKPCRNYSSTDHSRRCSYGHECAFSHIPIPEGKTRCYKCGQDFANFASMMTHRKIHHEMAPCRQYIQGQCSRGNSCWNSHTTSESTQRQTIQGFQQRVIVREPPGQREVDTRTMMNQMSQLMTQMNQMIVQMKRT